MKYCLNISLNVQHDIGDFSDDIKSSLKDHFSELGKVLSISCEKVKDEDDINSEYEAEVNIESNLTIGYLREEIHLSIINKTKFDIEIRVDAIKILSNGIAAN